MKRGIAATSLVPKLFLQDLLLFYLAFFFQSFKRHCLQGWCLGGVQGLLRRVLEPERTPRRQRFNESKVEEYVPFVNRPFESEIHGTVNVTYFCCVLLVTWCQRVRFLCYLRPK